MVTTRTDWRELIAQVPRDPFIPETIWVDVGAAHSQSGFTALSKHDHGRRWRELVAANEPVVIQVDEGHTAAGDTGWSPSSSCSKPSIVAEMLDALEVRPGHSVLEIGTGTGWNAALLCRQVGSRGQVVSIEVDPVVAEGARAALAAAGYSPLVITGDGVEGYPEEAPYDRVLATAAVRETVPPAWLQVPRCALTVELNKFGEDHHVLELDDITTQSWARLDAHLTSPNPLVVHQLGPRRLWDEAVAAYDWWYEHDKPDLNRFGMTMITDTQTVWLDDPSTVVRTFDITG